MEEVVIIGGGGHAKVLLDCIEEENKYKINCILDDDPKIHSLLHYNVFRLNHSESIPLLKSIIAIGNCNIRHRIATEINLEFFTSIHPKAVVSKYARVGKGSQIFAGSIINSGATIGNHCIINTGTIVEHDCEIRDYVHISPNTSIGGAVKIGEGTHIGIGTSIIQNVQIGRNVIVGAGAVVISDLPDNCTAVGIPAKPIKFHHII